MSEDSFPPLGCLIDSLSLNGSQLLSWRRDQLKQGGCSFELDWLLDFAGGLTSNNLHRLILDPDQLVRLAVPLVELEAFWKRHIQEHVPLQHLVGICPWRDLLLYSTPEALIPRQETELLVDLAFNCDFSAPLQYWADLGTGCGAIAICLSRAFPASFGHAVDCSLDALSLAQRNLKSFKVNSRCCLHQGNWWEPLKPWWGSFDLVISNPPYIPKLLLDSLANIVRDYEPHLALNGGADGLDSIREIIKFAPHCLAPGGWLLMEHHYDQSDAVLSLMSAASLNNVRAANDFEGVPRFAIAQRAHTGL